MVHYLLLAGEARRRAERRAYDLRLLAREAELAALRAQVDPHFLFNSLNSISGLVLADPERARTMCLRLAELLRSSLRLGGRRAIALSEELELARRYLEVERFRFGERLAVDIDVAGECLEAAVPPMVLQPLVENAVRHGVAHRLDGGTVRIEGRLEGQDLRLEVTNPLDVEGSSRAGEGIGQGNVERRLEAFFGAGATFVVRPPAAGEELYRVVLRVPFLEVSEQSPGVHSGYPIEESPAGGTEE
jgi:LytS/YehU family sensor histidine kinase